MHGEPKQSDESGKIQWWPWSLALLGLTALLVLVLWAGYPGGTPADAEVHVPTHEEQAKAPAEETSVRGAEIREAYAILKEKRRTLRRHLGRLKHETSGLRLPAEQAKELRRQLSAGFDLLQAPRLAGGFHDVQQIRDEVHRLDYIRGELEQAEVRLKEPSP